jgi:flagellar biosynthetic protein FlhB
MAGNKKHDPTERKLRRAREEGQVPSRQTLVRALVLVGVTEGCIASVDAWWAVFVRVAERAIDIGVQFPDRYVDVLGDAAQSSAIVVTVLSGAAATLAIGAGLLLNGFLFSPRALALSFDRIDPIAHVKNQFGARGWSLFALNVVKLVVFLTAAALIVRASLPGLASTWQAPDAGIGALIGMAMLPVVRIGEAVLLVSALVETVVESFQFKRGQRMDDEELKQDYREANGDGMQKAVRQALARADLESTPEAGAASVPDVVLANPTHYAITLLYRKGTDQAPRVMEKRRDEDAVRLIDRVRAQGVTVVRSPAFTRALFAASAVGQPIPAAFNLPIAVIYRLLDDIEPGREGAVIDVPPDLLQPTPVPPAPARS